MRSFSFPAIIVLCLVLLLIDVFTFYWLLSITRLILSPFIRNLVHVLFWVFTLGLVSSIILLKLRMRHLHPKQRHRFISSLYGLTIASFIPKLIFVIVITVLYFTNFLFSEEESVWVVPIAGLLSGFLPFFVIVYGILRTLYRFKVHHIHIRSGKLPESFEGWRIVQISDLHLGSFNHRYHTLDKAVKMINRLEPHLICFTGDLVNNYAWELKGWSSVLKQLVAKRGKYSVLGNHDYGDYSKWASDSAKQANFESIKYFHKKIGFRLLLNESEPIGTEGDQIVMAGVENWGNPPFHQYGDLSKALENTVDIPFKILLSHDPSHWSEEVAEKTDIALTLSGHTHGMQAGISFRGRQWSPIKLKYKHWAGLYRLHDQYLYVNRGLGWLGFPGRLGMRPEITLIELRKAGQ